MPHVRELKKDAAERDGKHQAGKAASPQATGLVDLQHKIGNQATIGLLAAAQAKLEVGAAGDRYEREADDVAGQVIARLRSKEPGDPREAEEGPNFVRRILRRLEPESAAVIGPQGGQLDQDSEARLQSSRGSGHPLPSPTRTVMESAFGADFADVKLHDGKESEALNRQMGAVAFTIGSDIFLGGSAPQVSSPAGERLLAHELTHTIQQGASKSSTPKARRLGETKTKTTAPKVTPELARDIQNGIAKSKEMKEAEELRALGTDDGENKALALIEKFWDTGEVEAGGKMVALKDFKPLMFTPSERRVRQINKVRLASSTKAGFDKSVKTGQTDPNKSPTPYKDSKSAAPGAGVVGTVGEIGSKTSQVGGVGASIGSHFEDPSKGENVSLGAKLLDTHTKDPNDPLYNGPPSFESKSDWAGSVIGIVEGAFGLISGVADFIKQASSKESSKNDVAQSGASAGSTLTSTASTVAQMVEKVQGSELTTNMFHWVPGLSVLSNGLSAVKSALALVPRAVQLNSLRSNGSKLKSDAQREDVKLAVSRLAVRAAQQVEQESFAVAKSLTKAGLSLAEVISAGGFGIPRLASIVLDGVGVLHSVGHAIADFVRANATGKARSEYFGAKKEKSAEKLLNTDPAFAADAILTRATENDPQAIAILTSFGIAVPPIGGAALVKVVKMQLGDKKGSENMMEYDYDAIGKYDEAKEKLISAIKPEKTVGETVDNVTSLLTERTQGFDTAKRLAEIRNEIGYNNKKDRGFGYKLIGFFKGKSGQDKSVDKTEKAIRNDTGLSAERKKELIAKLRGTDSAPSKDPGGDPQIGKPVDNATFAKAMKMTQGEIYQVILDGPKTVGGPGPKWEAYLAAYVAKNG